MHLLYCDETNLQPSENRFFIYGGLAFDTEAAKTLHDSIEAIRKAYSIAKEFSLKFNPKPDHLDHAQFIAVKKRVIEAAVEADCALLVSIILHSIATSPDDARRNEINRISYHFNCLLEQNKDHGLVLIDRFHDRQIDAHLRDKFAVGVTGLPYSKQARLDCIVGFHYSAIGQSHFGSVTDIILGSLRFAVNAHATNDESRLPTAACLLDQLAPLFKPRSSKTGKVDEISLFFSPKVIKSDAYREQYNRLRTFLATHGIEAAQTVTDVRTY